MKNLLYNAGYFLREAKTMLRLNPLSNIFSLLSTGLIFFILAMVIAGWWGSNQAVEAIKGEAEISVYFNESMDGSDVQEMLASIKEISGVREARLIGKEEAYGRMESILGKEARVLEYFEDNPFSPFIEVKIQLEQVDSILNNLGIISGVEHVRDNREVLERLGSIAGTLKVLGYLVVIAVGISTLVIISHIIRMGIYDNREQINTLRLMGAPEAFVGLPFLIEGIVLTLGGGALASVLAAIALKYLYLSLSGPLPFIPLPPRELLTNNLVILILGLSGLLGAAGSLFGLTSAKSN